VKVTGLAVACMKWKPSVASLLDESRETKSAFWWKK